MSEMSPIAKIHIKTLTDHVNELKTAFSAMDNDSIRSIAEDAFLNYFLPTFCGENKDNIKEILSYWYTVSGGSHNSVNIVDNLGNFIIQVPPVHNPKQFNPGKDTSSLAFTFLMAQSKAHLSPMLANNIVTVGLLDKLDKIEDRDSAKIINDQWNKLFEYYGKIKKIKINEQTEIEDEFE